MIKDCPHLSSKIYSTADSKIESSFLSFYHQYPASSSRDFALKSAGSSFVSLHLSNDYNDIMTGTSSISIIFDRTDKAEFSRIVKGLANRFFAVQLNAPLGGVP